MANELIGTFQIASQDGQVSGEMHRWMKGQQRQASEISSGKAAKTQTWEQSFLIEYPANQDYRVVLKTAIARTITNVVTRLDVGTCNLTVKLDNTGLGAGSAISVTTSEADTAYTTANSLAVGQDVVFTVASAPSTARRLSVTLSGSVTLA